jgi:phage terminase large subunit-like protein
VDTMDTATGARRQPLIVYMTTAGYDKQTICGEIHDYAVKVQKGVIKDDSFLPVLYCADPDDDWTEPKTWKKANPNLGISIPETYLAEKCKKAQEVIAYENTFKRLHLNMWTTSSKRWMAIEKWDASGKAGGDIREEDLLGRPCFSGLDLANTLDINALLHVFPFDDGSFKILCRFFIPEETIKARSKKQSDNFMLWKRLGLVHATDGDVVDHDFIFNKIVEDSGKFDIRELAFDRWGATQISQKLMGEGIKVVPVGQGFASMSGPTKEMIRLVLGKQLHHGGNQVLRWMADNMVTRQDPAGNLKPDKEKSNEKIDGMIALVMALGRSTLTENSGGSVYDKRGLLVL